MIINCPLPKFSKFKQYFLHCFFFRLIFGVVNENLWKILVKSRKLNSMNAAYIEPDPRLYEEKLPNGL
ncbi:hypothetical protein BpHYR1_022627, partial [Brachionus plicatilis]